MTKTFPIKISKNLSLNSSSLLRINALLVIKKTQWLFINCEEKGGCNPNNLPGKHDKNQVNYLYSQNVLFKISTNQVNFIDI